MTDGDSRIMVLGKSGLMLHGPAAPTSQTLFDFLITHSEFTPVLPVAKELHLPSVESKNY